MARRNFKQNTRPQKDNFGCMWGLFHMLDFRWSPKFLSDRKHGSSAYDDSGDPRSILGNFEEKNNEVANVDGSKVRRVTTGKQSVKTLMEEEMARVKPVEKPRNAVEKKQYDPSPQKKKQYDPEGRVRLEKRPKKTRKNSKALSDLSVNKQMTSQSLNSNGLDNTIPAERSDLQFILAAFLVEIYKFHNQCPHIDCKNKISLCPALKSIVYRKLNDLSNSNSCVDDKHLNGSKATQSKEFMDALEILSSNKELFLKLLQDPNSHILQNIQNICHLREGSEEQGGSKQYQEISSSKVFNKQNRHNFFWKKDRSNGRQLAEGNDNSPPISRIVVLKPLAATNASSSQQSYNRLRDQEDGERVNSHFSVREIKRRLMHVIGETKKEQDSISTDGLLHKVPHGYKDSLKELSRESSASMTRKASSDDENFSDPTAFNSEMEPNDGEINTNDATSCKTGSFFYEEAMKHLTEMLNSGSRIEELPNEPESQSLEKMLYLPQNSSLSPRNSPTSEEELDPSPEEKRLSPSQQLEKEDVVEHLGPSGQNLGRITCDVVINQVGESRLELMNPEAQEGKCIEEEINPEGTKDITNEDDTICEKTDSEVCPELVGSDSHVLSERSKEEGSVLVTVDEAELVSECGLIFPSSPETIIDRREQHSSVTSVEPTTSSDLIFSSSPESTSEKPEQPSPVSVLEPSFADGVASSGCRTTKHAELFVQLPKNLFRDHDNYSPPPCSSDSGPTQNLLRDNNARFEYIKSVLEASGLISDQNSKKWYLDDQLLDPHLLDEVGISYNQTDDSKLLFGCIEEVLVEIKESFFRFTPRSSFAKHNTRPPLLKEVSKGVSWHLENKCPSTLEETVRKYLDCGSWMDLRSESESIVLEICDDFLDDLLEEAVFDLWL
ncbi:uncharacterized protein LOC109713788 isoform X2 [Ananas comosus]|uniref:Uncharacterized protein LOC109713788 isoform X2 n=1 Tax=Ananas comosus TaxID=4615 RepID=A0A6P5FK82_ANACO|nr:uncharacterized protein LOC109713788 isoform X2 [Ananas comosus]